jgi:hypothetical protein
LPGHAQLADGRIWRQVARALGAAATLQHFIGLWDAYLFDPRMTMARTGKW